MNYEKMSSEEKLKFLKKHYEKQKLSWKQIADLGGTYANKVRRDALKLGIKSRSKSQAQKVALEEGRSEHPTEGKGHSEEARIAISEKQAENWSNMSEAEIEARRQLGKEIWNSRSESSKADMLDKAIKAIQQASKEGSKVEKFLYEELTSRGYNVEFHKSHMLKKQSLELDLFVRDAKTVIEVDGPSHFDPVWGDDKLAKNQRADREKNGLILSEDLCMIRIRATGKVTHKYKRDLIAKVLDCLDGIIAEFPPREKRYIEL